MNSSAAGIGAKWMDRGKTLLEVKDLIKKYGDKVAVNGLNFHVRSGEIVGLLGLNGAGKSTTMNCITGYIAPTGGTIIVDGHDILKESDQARRVIGYLPEVFSFYPDMKVAEYLDFVCDLKGFTREKKARRQHIDQVCRQVGIGELTGRMIRNLSKGYKQRVGFAQALIGHPRVLILDEPTVGLDPSQIIGIRQLIRDCGQESTVIVSSHILSEIQAICSRIIVIHGGRIVADGTPSQLIAAAAGHQELTISARAGAEQIERVLKELPRIRSFRQLPETEEGTREYLLYGPGTADGTDEPAAGNEDKTAGKARGAEAGTAAETEQTIAGNRNLAVGGIAGDTASGYDLRETVFEAFADAGIPLLQLRSREATLEQTFLHLTGQDHNRPEEEDRRDGRGEEEDRQDRILEILSECEKAGNPDMVYEFASTSKITFAGSGIAAIASSKANLDEMKKSMTIQTIGYDKVNQLRHARYFKNLDGLKAHMKKHAAIMRPKFEAVLSVLDRELAENGIGTWTRPNGGYFISFDAMEGCAKAIVAKCKEAGVVLTGAGATYPYGKDPKDSNIRIAPSYPTPEELAMATDLFVLCVKLVSVEKLLEA